MKIQKMPSKQGREILFVYIPKKIRKVLGFSKGDIIFYKFNRSDNSVTLKRGGTFESEYELIGYNTK